VSETLLLIVAGIALATLVVVILLLVQQKSRGGESETSARALREELAAGSERTREALLSQMTAIATVQNNQIDGFAARLAELTTANERRLVELRDTLDAKLGEIRQTVEARLDSLQKDNAEKLEKMRSTVDEKLHETLEKRLGESFKQVADRLEQVHKGLGEMQTLAAGVGDLKRVLTNVKTRGTWGEVQLGMLLEQLLTREQYETNVATKPGSRDRVEFAIRLPGQGGGAPVWLPLDSKFPVEDYERLVLAAERADPQAVEEAAKALETRLRNEARTIRDKYVEPPATTDFAILYLPTEGLFAEALRRPGLSEALQREYRVTIAGPTTLSAMLNSLQMGFRTLAIEKRSSEVWEVLGAVKTEFGRFGEVLAATKRQLQTVANSIDAAEVRTRAMERRLKGVEALPEPAARRLLGAADDEPPVQGG
jgi:DNA recombination protein RmuC